MLLNPVIYYCFCSFCLISAEKIVIKEIVIVTVEVPVLGGVISIITSDSKKVQEKGKN